MKKNFTWYRIAFILALAFASFPVRGQDIHLSQFYEAPLLRNPSLAGIFTGDFRVQAVYRNQWNNVTTPYQTGALSGEVRFPMGQTNDYLTVAMQMTYDVAGDSHLQTSEFMPCLNYHKSLSQDNNMYLSLGIMGGIADRQLDPSKLTFNNQYSDNNGYDPYLSSGEDMAKYGYIYLDGAVGLSFSSTIGESVNFFIGGAYYHFNRPKVSFYNDAKIVINPKWQANAGITAPISDRVRFVGQFNQLIQGTYSETMIGGLIGYGLLKQGIESNVMVYGGLLLRWKDAVIPVVKLDMGKYDIAFSYDVNVSQLTAASQGLGGFEISLSYKGFFTNQNSSLNKMNCPRF